MSNADAARALAMIQRAKAKGRASDVSLTRPGTPGAYNPATGEVEGATDPATYTGVGVKIDYKQSDIDGSLIRQGDQKLFADAVNLVRPISGEEITVGTEIFTAQSVGVVAPGDTDVLYIVQIRGV